MSHNSDKIEGALFLTKSTLQKAYAYTAPQKLHLEGAELTEKRPLC